METHELKVNTSKKIYQLDGKSIGDRAVSIKLDINNRELPKVIIEMDSNVILEGTLLNTPLEPLHCEKCEYELGEFTGRYSVICPNCGELNFKL